MCQDEKSWRIGGVCDEDVRGTRWNGSFLSHGIRSSSVAWKREERIQVRHRSNAVRLRCGDERGGVKYVSDVVVDDTQNVEKARVSRFEKKIPKGSRWRRQPRSLSILSPIGTRQLELQTIIKLFFFKK